MRSRDQLLVFGMLCQIGPEKRAGGDQPETPLPCHGNSRLDKQGAKALASMSFRHLGMIKADRSGLEPVGCEGEDPVTKVNLEPMAGDVVLHVRWSWLHRGNCSTKAAFPHLRRRVEYIAVICLPNHAMLRNGLKIARGGGNAMKYENPETRKAQVIALLMTVLVVGGAIVYAA